MKIRHSLPFILLGLMPLPWTLAAQAQTMAPAAVKAPNFADSVRADFFAGMAGDQVRFERAMALCEAALAKDPQNPPALVWHGSGLLVRGDQLVKKGDIKQSRILFQKGLDEMDQAVALSPESPQVLLPQGATLLSVSAAGLPPDLSKKLLRQGVQDYEKVLQIQSAYFNTLPLHARGELLSGLADGWHRLGDNDKARVYYQRMVDECPGTSYARDGEIWLKQFSANGRRTCQGCHAQ